MSVEADSIVRSTCSVAVHSGMDRSPGANGGRRNAAPDNIKQSVTATSSRATACRRASTTYGDQKQIDEHFFRGIRGVLRCFWFSSYMSLVRWHLQAGQLIVWSLLDPSCITSGGLSVISECTCVSSCLPFNIYLWIEMSDRILRMGFHGARLSLHNARPWIIAFQLMKLFFPHGDDIFLGTNKFIIASASDFRVQLSTLL